MSDVLLAAVKGFLYTSFAMNLQWMLKSVITSVFMIGWIINLFHLMEAFPYLWFYSKCFICNLKGHPCMSERCIKDTVITACHTVLWYSLLKMMAEIKHSPLGKGQMANNCSWPLSKNAHSQLPFITSSYIFPGGPRKRHWHVLCERGWTAALPVTPCEHHCQCTPWQLLCPDKICNNNHMPAFQLLPKLCSRAFLTWFVVAAHKR